jgi:hypothetical protein
VNQQPPLAYAEYAPGEWLTRIGDAEGAPLLFLPPLFEEMNRCRALLAAIMRLVAGRGIPCELADLPGTGESLRALKDCAWADWRHAVVRLVSERGPRGIVSVRAGCLLDDAAPDLPVWRLVPVAGASIVRDLERAGLAGGATLAGYPIAPNLLAAVKDAAPVAGAHVRTARLRTDAAPADVQLPGPALWRRSEPGASPELAQAAANDILEWIAQCAGC